ncbi:hypothetical protein [Streptomyces sp. enrichment culture]|uniref:hypothetical protein n=1 Tax=Streptomyces sp. enrichment culture TaxID=1795815 RepID=UPI003F56E138
MGTGAADAAAVDGVGVGIGAGGQVWERLRPGLDLVHSGVGGTQETVGAFAGQVCGAGDAQGHAQLQHVPVVGDGLVQLLAQGGDVSECGFGGQGCSDGELVATEPGGQGLPSFGPRGEALAGGADDGVAGGVSLGVVDGFEAVLPD